MLTNPTVTKLHEMRLSAMATAFRTQMEDPQFSELNFEDRFSLLVEAEWSTRKSKLLARLRKKACNQTVSTIFCSQFDIPGWHEYLYDPTLADAICDRIIHNSHIVTIKGDSMRKLNAVSD